MKKVYLKEANMEDVQKEYKFITQLPEDENGFTNKDYGCSYEEFEKKILPGYIDKSNGINLSPGHVPGTEYFLWDGDTIVGLFRIRHHLCEALANGAGHIGYGIKKEYRGKGYANEGLRLTIEKAWEIIPEDEIYMSVHKDNPASLKTQLKNGAYIHHEDDKEFFTRVKRPEAELGLVEADDKYADDISAYRQEFIDCEDHMDGCGSLRKFENPLAYIENCRQRAAEDAPAEIGGHAQQFFCIRKSDEHLIGMIQYRYEADPKFQIGYSVRPCDRGHGYAKWMLKELLLWLKQQGMEEATIACEPSNIASEHVILSCGGKVVETCNYKGIELRVYSLAL